MTGSRYQEQEEGVFVPGRGVELVELLEARDGQLTHVSLADGRTLRCFNIAAGRDIGAEWEHISTNISPFVEAEDSDFTSTGDVISVVDPHTSEVRYRRLDA